MAPKSFVLKQFTERADTAFYRMSLSGLLRSLMKQVKVNPESIRQYSLKKMLENYPGWTENVEFHAIETFKSISISNVVWKP